MQATISERGPRVATGASAVGEGFVFQSHTLWSHMRVARNMACGLSKCRLPMRNPDASPRCAFMMVSPPRAAPGLIAGAIFAFLISLDAFPGTFHVRAPGVRKLPLTVHNAAIEDNEQIASTNVLLLAVPSVLLMLFVARLLQADVPASVGK